MSRLPTEALRQSLRVLVSCSFSSCPPVVLITSSAGVRRHLQMRGKGWDDCAQKDGSMSVELRKFDPTNSYRYRAHFRDSTESHPTSHIRRNRAKIRQANKPMDSLRLLGSKRREIRLKGSHVRRLNPRRSHF